MNVACPGAAPHARPKGCGAAALPLTAGAILSVVVGSRVQRRASGFARPGYLLGRPSSMNRSRRTNARLTNGRVSSPCWRSFFVFAWSADQPPKPSRLRRFLNTRTPAFRTADSRTGEGGCHPQKAPCATGRRRRRSTKDALLADERQRKATASRPRQTVRSSTVSRPRVRWTVPSVGSRGQPGSGTALM